MDPSLILRGGWLVDGTGSRRRRADVVIGGQRVRELLSCGAAAAVGLELDVTGLVVAPGFIDMHAHSDLAVVSDPAHLSKVLQGVTTEVCGQDGLSYAPASEGTIERMVEQLTGWNGTPEVDVHWGSVAGFLNRVDDGAAVNVAYLVPHGTVRYEVMGDAARAASEAELQRMRIIVEAGLRDGAVGLSTGLTYTPGMHAADDELVALCEPIRRLGGYHCTHHRNYGARVVDAYLEAIALARRARVPLHLAHCHVNFPENRDRAGEVLAAVDRALAAGQDVTLDSYPYLEGATYLHALLPAWAQGGGGADIRQRLLSPSIRSQILHEMEVVGSDGHHGMPVDWETVVVAGVVDARLRHAVGRSIARLAHAEGSEPGDCYLDLLVADELRSSCRVAVGNEGNVRAVMRHRKHTVGTDGILIGESPHPRGWGTFPRILGHYVRELGLLELEDAVAHMTGRAARRLGQPERGRIVEGARADVVVFDPETVGSAATSLDPKRPPTGIEHVLVNGEFTVRDGGRTHALPGRSIRGPAYHSA